VANLKAIAGVCLISLGLAISAPQTAMAQDYGATVIAYLTGPYAAMEKAFTEALTKASEERVRGTIEQTSSDIRREIDTSSTENVKAMEGLEVYRQEQALREKGVILKQQFEMPASTCNDMAAQDAMGKATIRNQAAIIKGQTEVRTALVGNTNTLKVIDEAHKRTNEKYCTKEDAGRGICTFKDTNELSGADQDALFLFQARNGSRTYSTAPGANGNSAQYEAAGDYIKRMVVGIPVEQLRTENMDKTPQGRAYIELVRRYNGLISMSAYSLNQIREAGNPIKGLGNTTKLAQVEGFATEVDMSMNEAVRRYVANQFSPAVIKDLADSAQPHKILRAMATQNSFGLWMDFQALEQNSRVEGLLANQLVLVAEQSLRPQLEAQRGVATRVK